jgi:hypothetical protein
MKQKLTTADCEGNYVHTGRILSDLTTEPNSYHVIAHCSDGDLTIKMNGCSLFDYHTACDIKKDLDGLGAEIEIVKCVRVMYEVQQ